MPFGSPIALLTGDEREAERLRHELATVGFDKVVGYAPAVSDVADLGEPIEQLDAHAVPRAIGPHVVLLDVREEHEYSEEHVDGAIHMPYAEIRQRASELPRGRRVLAYCAGGVRSSLAASILQELGYHVLNTAGGFATFKHAGVPTKRSA